MGREGFGPSKAKPTDLQSAPFDRSGTSPKPQIKTCGKANSGIRTLDPEITNHVLWPAELNWRKICFDYTGIVFDGQVVLKKN